jgi:hypothetical protein
MTSFYVNSYAPLVSTSAGVEASRRFGIEPFVDYSIRREPDLEHEYPAITCVCRGGISRRGLSRATWSRI